MSASTQEPKKPTNKQPGTGEFTRTTISRSRAKKSLRFTLLSVLLHGFVIGTLGFIAFQQEPIENLLEDKKKERRMAAEKIEELAEHVQDAKGQALRISAKHMLEIKHEMDAITDERNAGLEDFGEDQIANRPQMAVEALEQAISAMKDVAERKGEVITQEREIIDAFHRNASEGEIGKLVEPADLTRLEVAALYRKIDAAMTSADTSLKWVGNKELSEMQSGVISQQVAVVTEFGDVRKPRYRWVAGEIDRMRGNKEALPGIEKKVAELEAKAAALLPQVQAAKAKLAEIKKQKGDSRNRKAQKSHQQKIRSQEGKVKSLEKQRDKLLKDAGRNKQQAEKRKKNVEHHAKRVPEVEAEWKKSREASKLDQEKAAAAEQRVLDKLKELLAGGIQSKQVKMDLVVKPEDPTSKEAMEEMNLAELYRTCDRLEAIIVDQYRYLRAVELAMLRAMSLEEAIGNIDMPKPERAEFQDEDLTGTPRTAVGLDEQKKVIKEAVIEVAKMEAYCEGLLQALRADDEETVDLAMAEEEQRAEDAWTVEERAEQDALEKAAEELRQEAKAQFEKALEEMKKTVEKAETTEKEMEEAAKEAEEKQEETREELEKTAKQSTRNKEKTEAAAKELEQAQEDSLETMEKQARKAAEEMKQVAEEAKQEAKAAEDAEKKAKDEKARKEAKEASEAAKELAKSAEKAAQEADTTAKRASEAKAAAERAKASRQASSHSQSAQAEADKMVQEAVGRALVKVQETAKKAQEASKKMDEASNAAKEKKEETKADLEKTSQDSKETAEKADKSAQDLEEAKDQDLEAIAKESEKAAEAMKQVAEEAQAEASEAEKAEKKSKDASAKKEAKEAAEKAREVAKAAKEASDAAKSAADAAKDAASGGRGDSDGDSEDDAASGGKGSGKGGNSPDDAASGGKGKGGKRRALQALLEKNASELVAKSADVSKVMRTRTPSVNLIEKNVPYPMLTKESEGMIWGRRIKGKGGVGAKWLALDSWYMVGPWPNPKRVNRDKKYPPENKVDLDATYVGKDGRQLKWEFVQAANNVGNKAVIAPTNKIEYTIYYLYTEVWSDESRDLWFATGSDDKSKVWINDMLVWESVPWHKGWGIGEGYRKVYLKKGFNRILYRLENGHGGTGMSLVFYVNPGY